jgi:hypothetical protein
MNYLENLEDIISVAVQSGQLSSNDGKNMTDDEFLAESWKGFLQRKKYTEFVEKYAPTLTTWEWNDIPDECSKNRFQKFSEFFDCEDDDDKKTIEKIYCSLALNEILRSRIRVLRRNKAINDGIKSDGLFWDKWAGFIRYIPYEWFAAIPHNPTSLYKLHFLNWLKHEGLFAPDVTSSEALKSEERS